MVADITIEDAELIAATNRIAKVCGWVPHGYIPGGSFRPNPESTLTIEVPRDWIIRVLDQRFQEKGVYALLDVEVKPINSEEDISEAIK